MTDAAVDPELAAFCRSHHGRLVAVLTVHCGDPLVAQELAQEALIRACGRWSQVRRMRAPGAWLYRVGVNLASSAYRRRKAEDRAYRRHGAPPDAVSDPDVADRLAVRAALQRLPRAQRTVLALRFSAELTVAETAEVMGTTQGAVKAHTHRAMTTLRAHFAEPAAVAEPRPAPAVDPGSCA